MSKRQITPLFPLWTFLDVPMDTSAYISLSGFSTWPHLARMLALIQGNQLAANTQGFYHKDGRDPQQPQNLTLTYSLIPTGLSVEGISVFAGREWAQAWERKRVRHTHTHARCGRDVA